MPVALRTVGNSLVYWLETCSNLVSNDWKTVDMQNLHTLKRSIMNKQSFVTGMAAGGLVPDMRVRKKNNLLHGVVEGKIP